MTSPPPSNPGPKNAMPLADKTLEEIVVIANKIGMEYVNVRKEVDRMDLLKSTIKARAMIRYDDGKISEARIRRLAETDDEYVKFLEDFAAKKAESEQLKMRYDSYKNLFEARRSMLSYQKAELKLV
jgi:hypothetical protein